MNFQGLLGIALLPAIAYVFSRDRKNIEWNIVIWGLIVQVLIAATILGTRTISLGALFIFMFSITWYNIEVILEDKSYSKGIKIFLALFILIGISFVTSLLKDKAIIIRSIVGYFFLIIGATQVITNGKLSFLPKKWANVTGILVITTIFGYLIGVGKSGVDFFEEFSNIFTHILSFVDTGGEFLFGPLYKSTIGSIFIVNVGSTVIFFMALIAIVDNLGLLNQVIKSIARFMDWSMRSFIKKPLSGAEMITNIAGIPTGDTALLLIKNYLDKLTESEVLLIMTSVMATISGTVFPAFVSMGIFPTHLLAASAMSIPAAITLSKIVVPETNTPLTAGQEITLIKSKSQGLLATITDSFEVGIKAALIMGAALIVFISLIDMVNSVLLSLDAYIDGTLLSSLFGEGGKTASGEFKGIVPGSLQTLFGVIFAPLAFAMGAPIQDAMQLGYLMGTKISINEFVAYSELGKYMAEGAITRHTFVIASFALCGFANPGTLALLIGLISPFLDKNKDVFIKNGVSAILLGAGASWMTASIASLFLL